MNVNTVSRTLLASVIGSAFALGMGAPSVAHAQAATAQDSAAQEQSQGDEDGDKAAQRRARQAARAAERNAQAPQQTAQPQAAQSQGNANQAGTVDAWQINGNAAAAQEQARQQQQAQREAQLAQLREVQERQRQLQDQQRRDQDQQLQAARERENQRERADEARTAEQQRRMGEQQRQQEAAAQLQAQQSERLARDARQRDAQIADQRERQRALHDHDLHDHDAAVAPRQDDGRFTGQRDDQRFTAQDDPSGQHLTNAEAQAARDGERRRESGERAASLSRSQQAALIELQRRQAQQYSQSLAAQQALARQQALYLQQQDRNSQYAYQQRYYDLLRQQGQRNDWQNYNYYSDPYFSSQPSYRYYRGGNYYQVSEYAARLLRQAVNYGYREGIRAGRADEQDGWRFDYRNSFAYQDANYGYRGFYVRQSEYNYYFRQGFRRGYEDGFYGRRQYGRRSNGNDSILATVLSLVLNLRPYSGGYNQSYFNNGY